MPLPITRGAASAKAFGFTQGGASGWWPLNQQFQFSNASTQGADGPSSGALNSAYAGQLFFTLGYFSSSNGIQILSNVPAGTYTFTLGGAAGNDPNNNKGTPGYGAVITCDFVLAEGSEIRMIVGQRGAKTSGNNDSQPGGGMSAFWIGASAASATQYGVAGGGGGSFNGGSGFNAPSNVTGANSDGTNNGNGGASTDYSSGGAGWLADANNTNGLAGTRVATSPRNGGYGFLSGGDPFPSGNGSDGGFGGGGGQTNNGNNRAGAGGGYTGGNGKNAPNNADPGGSGGGGSKFVGGVTSGSYVGTRTGAGYIYITRIA